MKFAIDIPNHTGDYADVRLVAEVAHEAEEAGWDGFFVWDHIGANWGESHVSDPWIMLTAIALKTERMRIGPMVTPIPRRRPWKLAREIVTLDQLTHGRVVLGVGTGSGAEYSSYHERESNKEHGEMLDEGLEVLLQLWSGEAFDYHGQYYQLDNVRHLPKPVQQPRIPIWVAGNWPNKKPMQRAAHWDGAFPLGKDLGFNEQMSPTAIRECLDYIQGQQSPERAAQPYDVLHWGLLEGKDNEADAALVETYAEAGVTWWVENICWERGSLQQQREYIRKGPPRP